MIKLRLTRDDKRRNYMSYVCTTNADALMGLMLGKRSDDAEILRGKTNNWVNRHIGMINVQMDCYEDFIFAINIHRSNDRVGTLIISKDKDGTYIVNKLSFDVMLNEHDEYDILLNDIQYVIPGADFI